GRQVGLSPWHVRLLRRTLALAVLGRRPEGVGRGLLSVVRNVSRYVVRDPLLVRDVCAVILRKLAGKPLFPRSWCSRPLPFPGGVDRSTKAR
ncbi:MAG: hypothetical protein K9N51_06580, partial [Candidatus Pacebacteria bacterium]|nr:hypothetical protein [Candidatus Paceibacterota bacterium]